MRIILVIPIMAVALALVAPLTGETSLSAKPVDYRLYAGLLRAHVKGKLVDYAGLKKDEAKLDAFLDALAKVRPERLTGPQKMAYYINLYNAWTLKLILSKYPHLKSIKDLGTWFSSPWKKEIVRIRDKTITLDNVEHDILRPVFKDPRVHFAVNCASKGCPPLRGEPYTGARLEEQLNDATANFINDPQQTYLKGRSLHVTRIMKWFQEDFPEGPYAFVLRYAQGDFRARLQKQGGDVVSIEYLSYDWALNDLDR